MKRELLTIIGTAHVSEESVNEVKDAIYEQHPDIVAIELDNGNILIVSLNNALLYAIIIDKNVNVVKSYPTYIGTNYHQNSFFNKTLKMANGNILICGYYNNTGYAGYAMIIDKDGNLYKASTKLHDSFAYLHMLEMSDGNIMISGNESTYGYNFNIMILKLNEKGKLSKKMI